MPHSSLTIRAAAESDLPGWTELRRRLWPDCPPERHALEARQLLGGNGVVVVACRGEELVGFAEVSVRSDHVEGTTITPVPYLEGWYVLDHQRGQGIGQALVSFVENWSRQHGFNELASDAETDNAESIRLHGLLGFREVGRTVHFIKAFPINET